VEATKSEISVTEHYSELSVLAAMQNLVGDNIPERLAFDVSAIGGRRVAELINRKARIIAELLSQLVNTTCEIDFQRASVVAVEDAMRTFGIIEKESHSLLVLLLKVRHELVLCVLSCDVARHLTGRYSSEVVNVDEALNDKHLTVLSVLIAKILAEDEIYASERIYFTGLEVVDRFPFVDGTSKRVQFDGAYTIFQFRLALNDVDSPLFIILPRTLVLAVIDAAKVDGRGLLRSSILSRLQTSWQIELQLSIPLLSSLGNLEPGCVIALQDLKVGTNAKGMRGLLTCLDSAANPAQVEMVCASGVNENQLSFTLVS